MWLGCLGQKEVEKAEELLPQGSRCLALRKGSAFQHVVQSHLLRVSRVQSWLPHKEEQP